MGHHSLQVYFTENGVKTGLSMKLQTAVMAELDGGLLPLILGKRLQLEKKQSTMMKM